MTLAKDRKTADVHIPEQGMEIKDEHFVIPEAGLTDEQRKAALTRLSNYLSARQRQFMGYQTTQNFKYKEDLGRFLDYHFNNVGDPFEESHFTLHTRWLERNVLKHYAKLWQAPPRPEQPTKEDVYWGYVLTMGSSEGNVYALWNARDYLSGKTLMVEPSSNGGEPQQVWVQDIAPANNANAYTPVAFYSQDTHYSVAKALRVLGIPNFYEMGTNLYPHANPLNPGQPWEKEVPSTDGSKGPGTIDIDKLVTLVKFFASMGHPILLNLNYGSTFKGAYDDVETICKRLREEVFSKYGLEKRKVGYGRDPKTGKELVDERTGYWINIDGALGAMYGPHLHQAIEKGLVAEKDEQGKPIRLPKFDFSIPEVSSIVTSGHKYPGAPWPCGIFMTKRSLQMKPPEKPDVIGSGDTTFGGSRSAFSPVVMWDFLAKHPKQKQIEMIAGCQKLASELAGKMAEINDGEWDVHRTPWSLSVWFRKPYDEIVEDFSLATVSIDGEEYAHFYVMPHVTRDLAAKLLERLEGSTPAPPPVGQDDWMDVPDGIAEPEDVRRLAYVPTARQGL